MLLKAEQIIEFIKINNMKETFEIVFTIMETIEEYKKGNINKSTLELIIKGAIELIENKNK